MRRIISLILSVILLLATANISYADETQSIDEQQFAMLKALNIVCGVNYDEGLLYKEITKSSYINFIMNIALDVKYTDDYNAESLQNAQNMGFISSANSVGESDKLSLNEALTIAVRLLGYELEAQDRGGYPAGYIFVANSQKLIDDVESGDKLTYSQVFKILYNITEADCSSYKVTGDGPLINYSKSVNALEYFRHIYKIEGVVTDNGESGLYGDSFIKEEYVNIENKTYLKGSSKAGELLGRYAVAYVKDNGELDEIIFIFDKSRTVLEIDVENVSSVTENLTVLKFYESETAERIREIKIKPDAIFLKNGVAYSKCSETDFKKYGTDIILIDYENDRVYDYVNFKSYDTMVVEAVSQSLKKIYNKYTFDEDLKELDLGGYEEKDILIFKNGETTTLAEIETGDILTVYKIPENKTGKIKIYVETESFDGVVKSYSEKNKEIVVDGKTYELSELYVKAREEQESEAKPISVGEEYTFYLDTDGKIVYVVKASAENVTYAYLVKFIPSSEWGETVYYMSLFTEEGAWEQKTLAEKVKVNGTMCKRSNVDLNGEISACLQKDIIGVKYNTKGEINYIVTPTDYYEGIDETLLNRDTNVSGKTYRYNDTTFSNYYYMDGYTKVFIVPNDNSEDKSLYRIGTNYSFKSNNTPAGKLTGYNRDEFYNLDMVLWSSPATNIKNVGTTLYMVKEKGLRVNSDGDVLPYVNVASETYAGVTFEGESTDSGLDNVDVGDVIQIHINGEGRIDNCTVFYDLSKNDTSKKTVSGSLGGEDYAVQGYVLKKSVADGMILIDTALEIAFKLSLSKSVLIYDGEKETVRVGNINDIEKDDFVVVSLTKNQTAMVAVYKGI